MRKLIYSLLLVLFSTSAMWAQKPVCKEADGIVGTWFNQKGSAKIKIFLSSTGEYYGTIVWLKNTLDEHTGKPRTDKHNPDEKLRSKPLLGLMILRGFKYKGDEIWEEGQIYDPNTGHDYSCKMKLKDPNTLDVHGYIGLSFIGRSETWSRAEEK